MNTRIISVREDLNLDSLIKDYFHPYSKDSFPVVGGINDNDTTLLGMVTFKDAWNIPENRRVLVKVKEIMIPKGDLIIMDENRKADEALIQISKRRMGKVFVCNNEGRLIGLVSKTDIMNAASERSEFDEAVRKLQRGRGRE